MTPEQFRAAYEALGLTTAALARCLGLSSGDMVRAYMADPSKARHRAPDPRTQLILALRLSEDGLDPAPFGLPDPAETSAAALRR